MNALLCAAILGSLLSGAEGARPSVVILPVDAGPGAAPRAAKPLTDALAKEAVASGAFAQIYGAKELKAAVPKAQQKLLAHCTDLACHQEVAGLLGATHVLTGTLGKRGKESSLIVKLVDVRTGTAVTLEPGLCTAAPKLVPKLVGPALRQVLVDAKVVDTPAPALPAQVTRCGQAPAAGGDLEISLDDLEMGEVTTAPVPATPAPVPAAPAAPAAPALPVAVVLVQVDAEQLANPDLAEQFGESILQQTKASPAFSAVLGPTELEAAAAEGAPPPEPPPPCVDLACMLQTAKAHNGDFLVTGHATRKDNRFLFTAALYDVKTGASRATLVDGLCSDSFEDLAPLAGPSVNFLLGEAKLGPAAPPQLNFEKVSWCGKRPASVPAPPVVKKKKTAEESSGGPPKIAFLGLGGVGVALGGLVGVLGLVSAGSGLGWLAGNYSAAFVGLVPSLGLKREARVAELRAPVAVFLVAGGVALLLSLVAGLGGGTVAGVGAVAGS